MESPKEIYITPLHYGWYPTDEDGDKIKYIRADLAELTLKDVQLLYNIIADITIDGDDCLGLSGDAFWEKLYTEALRRFNSKRKKQR